MQAAIVDIAHFGVIAVNIQYTIRTTNKSAVAVADIDARCAAVKSAGSYVTDTDAFCRIERFF